MLCIRRSRRCTIFFLNDTATTEIYTLSLHDALPILAALAAAREGPVEEGAVGAGTGTVAFGWKGGIGTSSRRLPRSEEHTSELQSRQYLVCRLLLEKKKPLSRLLSSDCKISL